MASRRKKLKCSPVYKTRNNNSKSQNNDCLSHELLKKMKDTHNVRSDNKIFAEDDEMIRKELRNIYSSCIHDLCILKQTLSYDDYNVEKNNFLPIANWTKDPNKWLNTSDINNVLTQYEHIYPEFQCIGPCPSDWEINNEPENICHCNKLCEFDPKVATANNITKVGIVFNIDEHYKPGSHWVSMFMDIPKKHIYYFDSEGIRCPSKIKNFYHKMKEHDKQFKYFCNNNVVHQRDDGECGIYCIYFILHMLKTGNYSHFSKKRNVIKESTMKKKRKQYFNTV